MKKYDKLKINELFLFFFLNKSRLFKQILKWTHNNDDHDRHSCSKQIKTARNDEQDPTPSQLTLQMKRKNGYF